MSRLREFSGHKIVHTSGLPEDISFQKDEWSQEEKEKRWQNLIEICRSKRIPTDKVAVIGYNESENFIRFVKDGDNNVFQRNSGNAIFTSNSDVTLVACAVDCCLVGFISEVDNEKAIACVTMSSLNDGIITKVLAAFDEHDVEIRSIGAYIGACIGKCCYSYNTIDGYRDFSNFKDFVKPSASCPDISNINLHGAITKVLKEQLNPWMIHDIFEEEYRCPVCAHREDQQFMFPSQKRDNADEQSTSGQYGMILA